eukprot:763176-Hanusia_phi.AAC.3
MTVRPCHQRSDLVTLPPESPLSGKLKCLLLKRDRESVSSVGPVRILSWRGVGLSVAVSYLRPPDSVLLEKGAFHFFRSCGMTRLALGFRG